MKTALVVGGTGPTGPHIVNGLLEREFDVAMLHTGAHESELIPEVVEHIHTDPFDAEKTADALGNRSFDLAIVTYGRLRELAALLKGKTHKFVYEKLTSDHPIDLARYQVANAYMGRAGLINSGGASSGEGDLTQAVRTAVINKRAGGTGLISGRKAFQCPMTDGIALLNAIQDVYLADGITIA